MKNGCKRWTARPVGGLSVTKYLSEREHMAGDYILKKRWKRQVPAVAAAWMLGLLAACSSTSAVSDADILRQEIPQTGEMQEPVATDGQKSVTDSAGIDNPVEETGVETAPQEVSDKEENGAGEAPTEETSVQTEIRLPAGHRIIYSDGEIYGWTRYEYDELGRKDMLIFITPKGDEYWIPV